MNYRRTLKYLKYASREQKNTYASQNMPGVKEKYGYNDPENVCREEGYDECKEKLIRDDVRDLESIFGCLDLDGSDSDENRSEDEIQHNADPEVYHCHVKSVGALGSIPQCQDKTG